MQTHSNLDRLFLRLDIIATDFGNSALTKVVRSGEHLVFFQCNKGLLVTFCMCSLLKLSELRGFIVGCLATFSSKHVLGCFSSVVFPEPVFTLGTLEYSTMITNKKDGWTHKRSKV